jgi:hypothetical protein
MRPRLERFCLTALGALALTACRATPDVAPRPPFQIETDHYVGSVRSGPLAEGGPAEGSRPWFAELRVSYADEPPSEAGTPLSSAARLVFLDRGDETLDTRSELALGAVLLAELPSATAAWTEQHAEALLDGATTVWSAAPVADAQPPLEPTWDHFDVYASRKDGEVEVALVFEGPVAPRIEDEEGETRLGTPVMRREHVVLGTPELDGAPWRVFLPAARSTAPRGGLLLEIQLATNGDLADPLAAERGRTNLEDARARANHDARTLSAAESFHFESESALRALENERLQRPALVFLAQQTSATLTGDLALSASEELLSAFLVAVRERLTADLQIDAPAALGWFLDETAYLWMTAIAADSERELPPGLHSLLLVHTGELGRYPDLVQEVIEESATLSQLDERLVQENRIFLEDGHPAARVRAYDWLAARRAAPAGYDPLGALVDRRRALNEAAALEEGQ